MRITIWFSLMLVCALSMAQKPFNAHTEYEKQVKKYPDIKIYEPRDSVPLEVRLDIPYVTVDGKELHVDMFRPKYGEEKRSILVIVHGGGWNAGDKTLEHPIAKAMAQRGLATVCVEYRKSQDALYPAAVQDVKCALRWLRSVADEYQLDTTNVTIMGESAGGQIAALVGASNKDRDEFDNGYYSEHSSKVDRVIDVDGVLCFIHPDSAEGQDKPGKPSAATVWFGGPYNEKTALWDSASALYRVNEESADFLFINSSIPRFSAGQAQMVCRLKAYGKRVEERKTEGTPHTFWLFDPWAEKVVEWIGEYLR